MANEMVMRTEIVTGTLEMAMKIAASVELAAGDFEDGS